jgi:signal peptidase I
MSKQKNAKPSSKSSSKPGSKSGESAYAPAARALPVMAFVWIGLLAATAVAALCPRFTVFYAIYLLVTLGLAIGTLAFLDAVHRKGRAELHPAFKKFLGYGLVVHYAAAALPRVDWAGNGLIGDGRVTYMFILAMLCLAAGVVLFVASGRPAVFAGLGLISDDEVKDRVLRKKRAAENRKKGLVHGTLEWVDALGFAAILVILIQTFVFQLYEIPSESMVPAFLVKDRPFTAKLSAAPRVPLTDWRMPWLKLPKRGDIVTLANPRYPENQSVNLKKYLAQFVSMVTFTAVNIDKYLPDGSVKADPLVKRVVGVPGEKLMMVDDVLYSKRKGEASFSPVEDDKKWARSDLWKESPELVAKIEYMPMDSRHRAVLDTWDRRRREADPKALALAIASSARSLASRPSASQATTFLKTLEKANPDRYRAEAANVDSFAKFDPSSGNPIAQSGTKIDDLALVLALPASQSLRSALAEYAACPAAAVVPADAYVRGGRVLNLLIKDNALARAARIAELVAAGESFDFLSKDVVLQDLEKTSQELDFYVNGRYFGLYDSRNFPQFPSGDEYLGKEQYFAMGDNRYNSLDFRYRTGNASMKGLDPADPCSVQYLSNVDPFALELRYIEGYALFRIWPPSRAGAIR